MRQCDAVVRTVIDGPIQRQSVTIGIGIVRRIQTEVCCHFYNKPPDRVDLGSRDLEIPKEQSLLGKVNLNLDFTKHLGLTSSQSTKSADAEVGEAKSEVSSPRTPLTTQFWEGADALIETIIGKTAIEILGGEIPDDLWIEQHNSGPDEEGKMSNGDLDQTGGGVTSKSSTNDLHPADGDSKTWGQWAAETAIAAEHVTVESAMKVKDSAVSTVKYVADAAASKLSSIAEPATGSFAKNAGVASRDKAVSVEDLVDRYSTTRRTPQVGQKSVTTGLIDTGLTRAATITGRTRNIAETLRQNTVSALSPGDGDKELAKIITASLSSLPTRLKEQVWISSSDQQEERSLDGMPMPTNLGLFPEDSTTTAPVSGLENRAAGVTSSATGARSLRQLEHQKVEDKGEEKLDPIGPDKLMELWTIGNGTLDCTVNNAPLDSENFLSPQSPKTSGSASSTGAMKHTNVKAEAIADAHRSGVITEANAYVEAELRKTEAHAEKMLTKVESQRLQEESKAMEILKKEELRAELLVHNAEVKAEKLLAETKSKADSIGATAQEEYTTNMADAKTKAERRLAEIEETKQREMAELYDRVEEMILMREFPLQHPEPKKESVVKKVKGKVMSHIRGY